MLKLDSDQRFAEPVALSSTTTSGYTKSSETLPPAEYEELIKTDNGQTLAGR
jgi:hypothetical protein